MLEWVTTLFAVTNTDLSYVPSKWYMSLREYLQQASLTLSLKDPHILPKQRTHNFYIMDSIIDSRTFTLGQLRCINFSRLYLNVELASDICLLDGETLDASFLKGAPSLLSSRSTLTPATQHRPDEISWQLWRRAMKLWSHKRKLVAPLGDWILPLSQRLRQWPAYFHPTARQLYLYSRADAAYHIYDMDTTLMTQPHSTGRKVQLPAKGSAPMEIEACNNGWKRKPMRFPSQRSHGVSSTSRTPRGYTFTSYLHQQAPWEQVLLKTVQVFVPITRLHDLLADSTLASDGSHLEHQNSGTYGWIIGICDASYVECTGSTFPGHHSSSYRSEANGMLSILVFLRHAALFLGWELIPSVTILCDNEGLVKTAKKCRNTYLSPLVTDWDLLREIQIILQEPLFHEVAIQHIKGHSDSNVPQENLTTEQLHNVKADELASSAMHLPPTYTGQQFTPVLTSTMVQVHATTTSTITSHLVRTARESRTLPLYRDYLCTRWNSTKELLSLIDWQVYATSHRHKARTYRMTAPTQCKLACCLLPVGCRLNRIDSHRPAVCPLCTSEETDEHLPRCLHLSCAGWRTTLLKEIDKFFDDKQKKYNAKPELADMLREGLTIFLTCGSEYHTAMQEPQHRKAWMHQTNIGWYNLFLGHLAIDWQNLRRDYLQEDPTDTKVRPALEWLSAFVNLLQKHWRDLWQLRNGDVHGDDSDTTRSKAHESLWAQVQTVEALRPELDPSLQMLMDRVQLQPPATTYTLQQWLQTSSNLFKTQALAYQNASKQHMRPIYYTFFS